MSDLALRTEVALATASAALLSVHTRLSSAMTIKLSDLLPPERAIELYCRDQDLSADEAARVQTHALATMGDRVEVA